MTNPTSHALLGSSSTIESIQAVIADFYCTTPVNVILAGQSAGWVVKLKGEICKGVRVVYKRKRYRFESGELPA